MIKVILGIGLMIILAAGAVVFSVRDMVRTKKMKVDKNQTKEKDEKEKMLREKTGVKEVIAEIFGSFFIG